MWKAFREDPTPFGLVDTLDQLVPWGKVKGEQAQRAATNKTPFTRESRRGEELLCFAFGRSAQVCVTGLYTRLLT